MPAALVRVLYDGRLRRNLVCCYAPHARDGPLLFQLASAAKPLTGHAMLLNVYVAVRSVVE